MLYHRKIRVGTRYMTAPAEGIDSDFSTGQLVFNISDTWFNYSRVESDGSDIVFYQKDSNGKFQIIPSYLWQWTYGGTSTFILKVNNLVHTEYIYLAMEYGIGYTPPSGVVRDTGRTIDIETIIELWDDFDSFDSNKWSEPSSYHIAGSRAYLENDNRVNPVAHGRFYTKQNFDPWLYSIYFKGVMKQGDYYGHQIGWGVYWGVDNSKPDYKSYYYGSPGYMNYHGNPYPMQEGLPGGLGAQGYWLVGMHPMLRDLVSYSWWIDTHAEGIYSYEVKKWGDNKYKFDPAVRTINLEGAGGGGNFLSPRKVGGFGFYGNENSPSELDWVMVILNQSYFDDVDIDPEVEPSLTIETPINNVCSLIPEIKVKAENWLDVTEVNLDVIIITNYDETCVSFLDNIMIEFDASTAKWTYKMIESDDFLARGNFKTFAQATNSFGFSMNTTENFIIQNCYSDFRYKEMTRDFTNFQSEVVLELKNDTEERVNIKNFLQNINKNNTLVPIDIIQSNEKIKDNYLLGLKTTLPVTREHTFIFQFEQDEIYDALSKKEIYVDSRIVLYNFDATAWDVSSFVKSYSFDKDADLGAVQLEVELTLDSTLSPFYGTGEPYSFYGNKIEVFQKLKKIDGTIYESKKFTGWVSEASVTKVAVHLVAHDKFVRFNHKINEDIHISPTKNYVSEYLSTFDGTKFKGSHSGWAEYPPPRLYLGGKILKPGEFIIDYPRGIVQVFLNTLISGDVIKRVFEVNNFPDRKTFDLGYNIDYSSSPIVTHNWFEKIDDYSCVGGLAGDEVWIERFDTLDLNDYYIDYTNNKLILYVAIAADDADYRNHTILISAREILRVNADYYYQVEETNEAEDIIYDLAKEVGFVEGELIDTITERIYKGEDNIVYTVKNHIKTFGAITINGNVVQSGDWTDNDSNKKQGIIEFKEVTGINIIEVPLDAIVSLQHVNKIGNAIIWDLLDENCSSISNWDNGDKGTGISEVSPTGQFRFDSNLSAIGNDYAYRHLDIGGFPNQFTVEIKVYHDLIGTKENADFFYLLCRQADEAFAVIFASDGLIIRGVGTEGTKIGENLVKHGGSAEWQTWKFEITFTGITGEGLCDIYLKDNTHNWEKVGTSIPCSYVAPTTDGLVQLFQHGYTTDNMVTHVDYLKIATGGNFPPVRLDDINYYYADVSIKGLGMEINDYIEIDYDRHYFYKQCGKYGMVGIYVNPNKSCNIQFLIYDRIAGVKSNTSIVPANTWSTIMINAAGTSLDEIYKIQVKLLTVGDVDLNIDYFYLAEDNIQVTYDYYTMQKTGITVSEAWYLKEETESYMDIVDDLLGQVEPSYLVYVDKDGKLRGEYTKIASYVLKGQVIKRVFIDVEAYAGYFYLPDFHMKLLKTASTSTSDEEIYNAVVVLGKLADKNDVALYTDVDDHCSWAAGKAYGISHTDTLTNFIKYVPPDVPTLLIKKMQEGAPDTWVGLSMTDSNLWSGTNWYLTSKDGNAGNATINSHMLTLTLREPILFKEIAFCVGSYQNKKIREELYIEVEDESSNKWYPSGQFANYQSGATGSWIVWQSDFNHNMKIKYIHVYCSNPHYWITSKSVSNSKK